MDSDSWRSALLNSVQDLNYRLCMALLLGVYILLYICKYGVEEIHINIVSWVFYCKGTKMLSQVKVYF
jgi:hypothetical protein